MWFIKKSMYEFIDLFVYDTNQCFHFLQNSILKKTETTRRASPFDLQLIVLIDIVIHQ